MPLGLVAAWIIWRRFDERVERTPHRIDVLGSLLLSGGGILLVCFVAAERRAAEEPDRRTG